MLILLLVLVPPPGVVRPVLPGVGGPAPREPLRAATVERLMEAFSARNYRLETVWRDGEVPQLFLQRLPSGLGRVGDVEKRKKLFFLSVLPLVLYVNDVIRRQRNKLLALERREDAGDSISQSDRRWLQALARRYGVRDGDLARLRLRVDTIPPALALAQAAVESDWGRSRFARDGNALYGQWTFSPDKGMKPREAKAGSRHHVRHFSRLVDSVAIYAMNLNTNPAYAAFRRDRAEKKRSSRMANAYALAAHLKRYSEKREEYVRLLRAVIRDNALRRLREARLSGPRPSRPR